MVPSDEIKNVFSRVFGAKAEVVAAAPGRINLIGEHTDYNEGFVLPAAIDRGTTLVGGPLDGGKVELYSVAHQEKAEFSLKGLKPDPTRRWADYFKGVADQLLKRGIPLRGCRAVLAGDLPQGAGLSSSASLAVAAEAFLLKAAGSTLPDLDLIRAAQAAENDFVGVNCGIMDPFASYMGKENQALFLDCRSLEHSWIPLPKGLSVVVCDTGVARTLAGSAYNERRAQCEAGVQALSQALPGLKSLRDVSLCDFEKHQGFLDPVLLKRCRHVVTENQRVLDMMEALEAGRLERVKALMEESHVSLRDDYEVSCRELDLVVELAKDLPGIFGSRMTGAGFGGCTVHLVETGAVEGFRSAAGPAYEKKSGRPAGIHVFRASAGAKILNQ